MTTSGTQVFNLDSDGYCTQALKRLGVVTFGNEPRIEDMVTAKTELNAMVKNWRADGVQLWKTKWATIPLTASDVVFGSDGNVYECIRSHTSSADTLPVTGSQYLGYWKSTTIPSDVFSLSTGTTTTSGTVTTNETMVLPTETVTTAHGYTGSSESFSLSGAIDKGRIFFWFQADAFPAPGPGMAVFSVGYVNVTTTMNLFLTSAGDMWLMINDELGNMLFGQLVGTAVLSTPMYAQIDFDNTTGITVNLDGVSTTYPATWASTSITTGAIATLQGGGINNLTGKVYGFSYVPSNYLWVTATAYNSICNPQLDSTVIGTDKRIIGIGNAFLRNDQSQDSYINAHLQAFEYFRMGNKINPGKPTMLYFKRNATVDEFFLYPYPDTTDYLLNVELYYYPDDFNNPTDTADFLMEWEAAIIDGLTVRLYPLFPGRSRVALAELNSIFQDSYQRAKAGDSEKGDSQVVPDFWLNNGRY